MTSAGSSSLAGLSPRDFAGYLADAQQRAAQTANNTYLSLLSSVLQSQGYQICPLCASSTATAKTMRNSTAAEGRESTYLDIVNAAARRFGVDPALIMAVIRAESNFDPQATSSVGAKGLMQLMDGTARRLGVTDSFDPVQNIAGGTQFLAELLQRYDGDVEKTLAAYNAGPGAVDRYGGVPPFKETLTFVPRVIGYWRDYQGREVRT